MTLKHIAYTLCGIIAAIWSGTFVLVLIQVWSQDQYCFQSENECIVLDTLTSRMELANLAAVSLVQALAPVVITLMMIPFCFWFWRQLKKQKNKPYNKRKIKP